MRSYIGQRKIENPSELFNCYNRGEAVECKQCSAYDGLDIIVKQNGVNKTMNVKFGNQTPYYKDDVGPVKVDDLRKMVNKLDGDFMNPNMDNYNTKTITSGACKINNRETLQKLRCYCDYAMTKETADFDAGAQLWDMLNSGDNGLEKVITYLNKKAADKEEISKQVLGLMCKLANTTNPREAYDKSAIPIISVVRLTGWIGGNTISLIANLIFMILNILFFSSFIETLSGKNDKNQHLISGPYKIGYQIFLFIMSGVVLAITLTAAISKDNMVNTSTYLLSALTYSSVFASVIVLCLLFYSGINLFSMTKSKNFGTVFASFIIIGIIALTVMTVLFLRGQIPSKSTMTVAALLGFFLVSALYVFGSGGGEVKEEDRPIGLIAYSILILETIFGLFFPYLYFLIVLILRLITGVVMKTTYWTLIPLYFVSLLSRFMFGDVKYSTIIGVTDYNMFKHNFLTALSPKEGVMGFGSYAVIAIIIVIFAILLIMGV